MSNRLLFFLMVVVIVVELWGLGDSVIVERDGDRKVRNGGNNDGREAQYTQQHELDRDRDIYVER